VDFTDYSTVKIAPDLVNSLSSPSGTETMVDADTLREFLVEHEVDPPARLTDSDVDSMRKLRATVRKVFEAPDENSAAVIINRLIQDAKTSPYLTDHDGHWHMHYTSMQAPISDRIGAICGMVLAAVVERYGIERLGICAAEDCGDVFIDTSRNRSKRFCNDTCSSRTNVAAYRARNKAAT
jgi:predicted RNA-binding Zn ribbon-like protein